MKTSFRIDRVYKYIRTLSDVQLGELIFLNEGAHKRYKSRITEICMNPIGMVYIKYETGNRDGPGSAILTLMEKDIKYIKENGCDMLQ